MIGVVIILLACETAINIPMLIVVYFIVNPQVTSSPTYRGGGFLSQVANSRFSFEQSIDHSISELSPCAPRFFFIRRLCKYDPHAFRSYIDRGIEIPIVMAFASRALPFPHAEIFYFRVLISAYRAGLARRKPSVDPDQLLSLIF